MVQPRPIGKSRRKAHPAKRRRDRSPKDKNSRHLRVESLERRELLAVDLIGIRPDAGALLFEGDTLKVAPREFNLLFNGGANLNELTISSDTIKLIRSGGDDLFGDANDVEVNLGYVGLNQPGSVDPADLQLVQMRPASSASFNVNDPATAFPDDLYQIQIIGSGADPLENLDGDPFNDGVDLVTTFRLDRGAQVVSVVPQPISRNTQELDLGGATGGTYILDFQGEPTLPIPHNATNADIQLALEALPNIQPGDVSVAGIGKPEITFHGQFANEQVPLLTVDDGALSGGFASVSRLDKLTQATNQIVVFFDDQQLNAAQVVDPKFYRLIDTSSSLTPNDDRTLLPASVTYDVDQNSVVLHFTSAIPEGNYRLDVGHSGGNDDLISNALAVGSLFDENPFTHTGYLGDKDGSSADLTDADLFKVTLRGGATLTVNATPGAAGLVLATRLLDAAGAPVPGADLAAGFTVPGAAPFEEFYIEVAGDVGNTGFGAYTMVAAVSGSPIFNSDANSTVDDATQVGVLGSSGIRISSQIQPQTIPLPPLPGSEDEPGHRQIQREQHISATGTSLELPSPTTIRRYFFPDTIGTDTSGNPYSNLITETEKQIVREILEVYAQQSGFEFIETPQTTPGGLDMMIGKGDLRALDPSLGPNSGVAGLGGPRNVVLNGAIFDQSNRFYGDGFTDVMFHEIGHALFIGHSYDIPSNMGAPGSLAASGNFVLPGDHDIVHLQRLTPPDSTDVDMYRFDLVESGRFTAETIAERLPTPSLLNSALKLYRQTGNGDIELVAQNDQYFGSDAYLELHLEPGTYFVGVTSTGNTQYDPRVPDSGFGGSTNGAYDLSLNFEPERDGALLDSRGTAVDGDADGAPGGVHSFWFQSTDPDTAIYIDKFNDSTAFAVDGDGSMSDPYDTLDFALRQAGNRIVVPANATSAALAGQSFVVDDGLNPAVTFTFNGGANPINLLAGDDAFAIAGKIRTEIDNHPGLPTVTMSGTGRVAQISGIDNLDVSGSSVLINTPNVVHIVGNGGADRDIDTIIDNNPYLIGQDVGGNLLPDGPEFLVPQGVNVMLHAGALLKMRVANLDAGSSDIDIDRSRSSIQVLGTPNNAVFLRSFHNDAVGGDSDGVGPGPSSGNFGGIVFRQDSDLEDLGVFLNYVNHVDIANGGGKVFVGARESVFTPIHIVDARPTVSFNHIATSDDAAISASPDSFDDSIGRIGPDVHGNFLAGNTIDGLFIRIETPLGSNIDKLTVSGRFDDTDITHILAENLIIAGAAGGPFIHPTSGALTARPAGRLVIDPGTVVKLKLSRIEAERGAGALIAEGTVDRPIIFTSLADDRFGGSGSFDSNDDPSAIPRPEDWGGLFFGEATSGSIDHAVISYGGGTTQIEGGSAGFSSVEIHQADVRITNSLIQANGSVVSGGQRNGRGRQNGAAIYVRGAQPIILDNDIIDNHGSAISINANSLNFVNLRDPGRSTGTAQIFSQFADNSGPLIRLNRLDNNGTFRTTSNFSGVNGLHVRGQELTTQGVWDDTDIVHVLLDEIIVDNFHTYGGLRLQSSNSESLVVKLHGANAGITATGTPVETHDRIGGTVQVIGTVGHPVIVTHLADDTVGAGFSPNGLVTTNTNNSPTITTGISGGWRGFLFDEFSNDRNVQVVRELENALINGVDVNSTPNVAQRVGTLAPNEKSGDENRRLGFEVTGYISPTDPDDVDVYSFTATAGTPIWIDIDRTDTALDAIVEVVNTFGTVLARSMRSGDLSFPGTLLPPNSQLTQDPTLGGDHYTQNFRDPGLFYVLPGTPGEVGRYFVRVRSNPASAGSVTELAGESRGKYQLQIRIDQIQEFPGSTVQFADIRFAETGIDLRGLPAHSPMIGEAGELEANNDTYASAQTLINLLESDMAAINIAGELSANDGSDVDFYAFDVQQTGVQTISGVNDEAGTVAVVFDLDYSDNAVRSDATIAVYDSNQNLIYLGRESNVEDDQPIDPTGNIDDLSRGSIGKKDPFIGPIHLIPNSRYYVAVMSDYQVPAAITGAFYANPANAANTLVRLEPVNSLVRVVEDHIGHQGYRSRGIPIQPSTPGGLFDISTGALQSGVGVDAHVKPFTFQDVALYVGTDLPEVDVPLGTGADDHLFTVDPFITNRWLTRVDESGGLISGTNDIQDFTIRTDGRFYGYQRLTNDPSGVGALVELDPSNLTVVSQQGDNIPGTESTPNTRNFPAQVVNDYTRTQRANEFLASEEVDGLAIQRTGANAATVPVPRYDVYYSVRESDKASRLYRGRENGDASAGFANGSDHYGFVGPIQPAGVEYTITFLRLVQPVPMAPSLVSNVRLRANQPGAAGDFEVTLNPNRPNDTSVTVNVSGGVIDLTLGLQFNNQGQVTGAPTVGAVTNAINNHPVASQLVTAVIFSGNDNNIGDGSAAVQARSNSVFVSNRGAGNPLEGRVTGLSFGNWDGSGPLFGVTDEGEFLTINADTGLVLDRIDMDNRIGVDDLNFQGLTLGPQNVEGGRYRNTLFATTDQGLLVAFDVDGFGFTAFGAPDPDANFIQVISTGPDNTGNFFTLTSDATGHGNFGRQTTLPIRVDAPSTVSINETLEVGAAAHDGTFTVSVLDDLGAVSSPVAPVSASQPSIELHDISLFPPNPAAKPFILRIEDELMLVTDVSAGVYTVTRGYGGTTAAIHPDTATAFEVVSAENVFALSAPSSSPLTAAIDDQVTSTTLTVANVSGFPASPFTIRVEAEEMLVTNVVGNNLTVDRAQNGTSIAHHRVGREVFVVSDSIELFDVTPFPDNPTPANPFNLRIGGEDLRVVGRLINTYQVIRGANATPMTAHAADSTVHRVDTTVPLDYNATEAEIRTALENLQSVGVGNVLVTNGPLSGGQLSSPVTIEFVNDLAARNLTILSGDPTELVGDEIQEITLDDAVVIGGTFRLSFNGAVTGDIPWNATPSDVETALIGLSTIGPGDVAVTGNDLPTGPIRVQFTGDLQDQNVPDILVDQNALLQNEQQQINFTGAAVTAGTFTLDLNDAANGIVGSSQPIPFDANPAAVQSALEAGITELAGNIVVTGTDLPAGTMVIEFTNNLAGTNIAQFTFTRFNFVPAQSSIAVATIRTIAAPPPIINETLPGFAVDVPITGLTDGILSVRDALLNLPNFVPGDLVAAGELQTGGVAITFANTYATLLVNPLVVDNFLNLPDDSSGPPVDDAMVTLRAAPGPGTPGASSMQVTGMTGGGIGAIGLAFSPLDFNLWHPTTKRGSNAGHGINSTSDGTRTPGAETVNIITPGNATADRTTDEGSGGASFHFGFEDWTRTTTSGSESYLTFENVNAQYGILTSSFHSDLASNPNIVNTYNFPAGALGTLTTNSFSLAGTDRADRPTLYFNYYLETEAHPGSTAGTSDNSDPFRDSARVFISRDGLPEGDPNKLWELVATNNSALSAANPTPVVGNGNGTGELPGFLSHLSDPGLNALIPRIESKQIVQEMMDNTGVWRQARVDLSTFANEPNLEMRIDFSTAGSINDATLGRIDDEIDLNAPGDTSPFGEFQANSGTPRSNRSLSNRFEGFYIDDIIIGFAERGEMVTGTNPDANITDLNADARTRDSNPSQFPDIVNGAYQLEIRRTEEYIRDDPDSTGDPIVAQIFDTNDRHIPEVAPGSTQMMADRNRERPQGIFIIDSNFITDSSVRGINVEPGTTQAGGGVPHPGSTINFPQLNVDRLVPGAVIQNNVIAGSSGIRFAGETGVTPQRPVPFGRIINNTLVGDNQTGIGIEVVGLAQPTLMNNLLTDLDTGISVAPSAAGTVIRTNFFQNTVSNGNAGTAAISVGAGTPFIDAANRNYYLRSDSLAVDSSQNTEQDRFNFVTFKRELDIPESPINAPDRDVYGQLRIDSGSAPGGGGSTIFKDRGAVDRSDKDTPYAQLLNPIDNDALRLDRDPNLTVIQLSDPLIENFSILLGDGPGPNFPFEGTGVNGLTVDDPNDPTVAAQSVMVEHDGELLVQGVDYTLGFNPFTGVLQLTPLTTLWEQRGVYTITLDNTQIADLAGNLLRSNQSDGSTKFFILMPDVQLDYGDAPSSFGTFLADNGARHAIIAGAAPRLGRRVDGEDRFAIAATSRAPGVFAVGNNTITVSSPAAGGEQITVSVGQEVATFELVAVGNSPQAGNVAVPWNIGDSTDVIASNLNDTLNSFFDTEGGVGVFQVNGASPSTIDIVISSDDEPQLIAASGSPIFDYPTATPSNTQIRLNGLPVGNELLTVRIGKSIETFQLVDFGFAPDPGNIAVQIFENDTVDAIVTRLADEIEFRLVKEGDASTVAVDVVNLDTINIETFDDEDGLLVGTFTDSGGTDRGVFLQPGAPVTTTDPADVLGFLNPHDVFGTTVAITATGNGLLDAWIDFNGDGAFSAGEQIFQNQLLLDFNDPSLVASGGANLLNIVVPPNTADGMRWARFRISEQGNLGPDELGIGGEVEDYQVEIINIPPTIPIDDNFTMDEGPQVGEMGPNILDTAETDMGMPPNFIHPSIFDNDPLSGFLPPEFVVQDQPAVGTLTVTDPFSGRFTYEPPDEDFFGDVTFTYWIPTQPIHNSVLPPNVPLGTVTITVNPVNDDPLDANAANFPTDLTVVEDVDSDIDLSSLDLVDVDAHHGTGILTVTLTTNTGGQLTGAAATGITFGGTPTALEVSGTLADLNAYFDVPSNITYNHITEHFNGPDVDTLQVEISDNGNGPVGSGGGAKIDLGTVNIDITAINDDPFDANAVNFPTDVTVTEGIDTVVNLSVLDFADVDADPGELTVTLTTSTGGKLTALPALGITLGGTPDALTISGTLLNLNGYFNSGSAITYLHNTPFLNGDDVDTIQVLINDQGNTGLGGGANVDLGTINVDIDAVNNDPFDANAANFPTDVTVVEGIVSDVDLSALDFADVDADPGTLTVTLTTTNDGQLSGATVAGITLGGSPTALTITGTLADLNAYFDNPSNITYINDELDLFGDDVDTISVVINDNGNTGSGGGGDIPLGTVNVDIDPVNDDPFNAGTLPTDITVDEDLLSNVDLSAIDLEDEDAITGNLTVTLTTGSGGTLHASDGGGVTVGGDGTGVLTLTGTLGDLNTFLDDASNVQYLSSLHVNGDDADTIAVQVTDNGNIGTGGGGQIPLGTVNVDITAINDAPTIDAIGDQTVDEDSPATTITLTGITTGAFNETSQELNVTATSGDTSKILDPTVVYTDPSATGTLTFAPIPDQFGDVTITVRVEDGGDDGLLATTGDNGVTLETFVVSITAVNDQPTIDPISGQSIDEDNGPGSVPLTGIGTGASNENDTLVVTATSSDTSIIDNINISYTSPASTGTLTYDLVADAYSNPDPVTITVRVEDGGATNGFVETSFTVTVNPVNDEPLLDAIADQSIDEDTGPGVVTLTGIDNGPANESEDVRISASSDTPSIIDNVSVAYTPQNDTATLTYSLVGDAFTNAGPVTITVTVEDAGVDGIFDDDPMTGVDESADNRDTFETFLVTVNAVNDAPTIAPIADQTHPEESGVQTVNLSGIGTGAANENEPLQITATSSDTSIIPHPTIQYTPNNSFGTLQYQPFDDDAFGTVTITVRVEDGGLDGSLATTIDNEVTFETFQVTLTEVNDAPFMDPISVQTIDEDAGPRTITLTGISAGAPNEDDEIRITAVSSDSTIVPDPTINYTSQSPFGTLTFNPAPDANGTVLITVFLQDAGVDNQLDTADDGVTPVFFPIVVNPINDPPRLDPIGDVQVLENDDETPFTIDLSGIAAGPANENEAIRFRAFISDPTIIKEGPNGYTDLRMITSSTAEMDFVRVPNAFGGPVNILVQVEDAGPDGEFDDLPGTPLIDESADNRSTAEVFNVIVDPVNDLPTIDPIADESHPEDGGPTTVNLTGIGRGAPNENEPLKVTATSSDPSIVPDPVVSYTTPLSDGTLVYAPVADRFGTVTMTVRVEDGGLDGDLITTFDNGVTFETFNVTIDAVNDPPTIDPISSRTVTEDGPSGTIGLVGISNGSSEETDEIRVTATSSDPSIVAHPTITYTSGDSVGTLSYDLIPDGHGTATITVLVEDAGVDGTLGTADDGMVSTVFDIVVDPVNDPPLLDPIADITVNEDAGLITVNLAGIDNGPSNESEAVRITTAVSDRNIIPNVNVNYSSPDATGELTFTTAANAFGGPVTITVTAEDAGLDGIFDDNPLTFLVDESADNLSVEQEFNVTINAVNDPPTLDAISDQTTTEDSGPQTITLTGITSGASNETQTLQVTATSGDPSLVDNLVITYVSPGTIGTLSYQPQQDQYGSTTITVTVNDGGLGGTFTQEFDVTVTPTNDAPTLDDPADVVVDEDSGEFTVNLTGITAGILETEQVRITATSDTLALIPDPIVDYTDPDTTGTLRMTPVADAFGVATITVTVEDAGLDNSFSSTGDNLTFSQTFTVMVNNLPDPPMASDDFLTTDEDTSLRIDASALLANDEDPDLGPSSSENLTIVMPPLSTSELGATLAYDAVNERIIYDPSTSVALQGLAPGEELRDSFIYNVVDGFGGQPATSSATVFLDVSGINDAPTVGDDTAFAKSLSLPLVIEPLANDFDVDGTLDLDSIVITQEPRFGSIAKQINGDGDLELAYSPFGGFTGHDTFRYTIADNLGQSSLQATVTIQPSVTPITIPDSGTGLEGDDVNVQVLNNDSAVSGQGTLDPATLAVVTDPGNGQAIVETDGTVTYRPDASFVGTDTFEYTIADTSGNVSDPTTVTVTIDQRVPPTTVADTGSGLQGDDINIAVLDNDQAEQGQLDPSTLTVVRDPASGQVTVNADGTLTYVPNSGFVGTDTFEYTIADTVGNVSTSTDVTVTVGSRNPPTTGDDFGGGAAADDIVIAVLDNDSSINGPLDPSSLRIVSNPANGQAIPQADGTVVYEANPGFSGDDSFTYTIADTTGSVSAETTVNVRVTESGLENPRIAADVNDSGNVSALDALLIINRLAEEGESSIPVGANERGPDFYDVNGSLFISALDALWVINHLAEEIPVSEAEQVTQSQPIIADMSSSFAADDRDEEQSMAEGEYIGSQAPTKAMAFDSAIASLGSADPDGLDLVASSQHDSDDDDDAKDVAADMAIQQLTETP